jgi:hypothetical protein
MNFLIALLRLIHIFSAVAWFGLASMMALYIAPTVVAAGENGFRYMKSLLTGTRIASTFPMVTGVAMLAGILLYFFGDVANFSTTGQIVLGIGALAGIAAGIHGGAVSGRSLRTFGETLAKYPDNQPIPADGLALLRDQATAVASNARVSYILVVIALIGMGVARFL